MKKIIKKITKKLKESFQKNPWELVFSNPCYCPDECNKVLIVHQTKNKNLFELSIDWKVAKEDVTEGEKQVSVLMPRKLLMDNLIASGLPISKLAEFDYGIDAFFADMQKESGAKVTKTQNEVTVDEFKKYIRGRVQEEFNRKK